MSGVSVLYVCLQATRQGQASYAHVHEIINRLEGLGCTVHLLEPSYARTTRRVGPTRRLAESLVIQMRALRIVRSHDVAYIRAHFALLPFAGVCRLMGIACVQEVNGPYADTFIAWPGLSRFRKLIQRAMAAQYRWADHVIVVTEGLRAWLVDSVGVQRVSVVPNGVDSLTFRPDAQVLEDLPRRYAVFVGALAPWQGIEVLLAARAEEAWPSDVSLVIAGDGACLPAVTAAAQSDEGIVYLGGIPYEKVPGLLAGAEVSVSPQVDLGGRAQSGLNPLKVYESMSCGTPVVVTDFPGQAELVRESGAGIVVDPGDPTAIAAAVGAVAGDPTISERMGSRARGAIVAAHTWQHRAISTLRVLMSTIDEEI